MNGDCEGTGERKLIGGFDEEFNCGELLCGNTFLLMIERILHQIYIGLEMFNIFRDVL